MAAVLFSIYLLLCIMALTVRIRVTDTLKRCSVQTAAFDPELQRHHITLQQLLHSS